VLQVSSHCWERWAARPKKTRPKRSVRRYPSIHTLDDLLDLAKLQTGFSPTDDRMAPLKLISLIRGTTIPEMGQDDQDDQDVDIDDEQPYEDMGRAFTCREFFEAAKEVDQLLSEVWVYLNNHQMTTPNRVPLLKKGAYGVSRVVVPPR